MDKVIGCEEGLSILDEGFTKAVKILQEGREAKFSFDDYMKYYEAVYRMCTQRDDYSSQLYDRYKLVLQQSIKYVVLPLLVDKDNEILLQELFRLWLNYEIMVRCLFNFLDYIDRYYTKRASLPPLNVVAISSFCDLVFPVLNSKINNAIVCLIARERAGEQVDVGLVTNVLSIILHTNNGTNNPYEKGVEDAILEDTAAFYSRKTSEWLLEYSLSEYKLKVEECLQIENKRLSRFLIYSSELRRSNLLQAIKDRIISACESQLRNNQTHGYSPLQNYLAINQDLMSRCANLSLNDGNSNQDLMSRCANLSLNDGNSNQDLMSRCANLNLNDGNSGAASCGDVDM